MAAYTTGDIAILTTGFTDPLGNPTDPTGVSLIIESPDGTQTTVTSPTHLSAGRYAYNLALAESGVYRYRWIGTGTVTATVEGTVTVLASLLSDQPVPSSLNLCTLDDVKTVLTGMSSGPLGNIDDISLTKLITSASLYWLWRTGRMGSDGSIPAVSPLVQLVTYGPENYDGNGNDRMFLRQTPVRAVTSLLINGVPVPPSTGFGSYGYLIDQNGRSLVFQSASSGYGNRRFSGNYGAGFQSSYSPCVFSLGTQNITVTYSAGYAGTPYDISEACARMVAVKYRRLSHLDEKQNAQPQTVGTITYRDWEVPPDIEAVIRFYRRKAIV